MVRLRLTRDGRKKLPVHHVVAAVQCSARDSRIESIGYFKPTASAKEKALWINHERYQYWIAQGAQASHRVQQLFKQWQKNSEAARK